MGHRHATTLTALQTAFSLSGYQQAEPFLEHEVPIQKVRTVRASVAIDDCAEPLVTLPTTLARLEPHPYIKAGAPYSDCSPWCVRTSVAKRLARAQSYLERARPGFRLSVFDAYRPLAVQAYMIQYECSRLARESAGQAFDRLESSAQAEIRASVMQFWASPDPDPTAPAPHTTGAALDVTIVDPNGRPLPMGTDIDDLTEKALPSYFEGQDEGYHANRSLLNEAMQQSGFRRNPIEWWHFSYGDQAWALIEALESPEDSHPAMYGAVD